MGNYLNTCNGIKSVSIIKSTQNDVPVKNKTTIIRLVLVGLDNAGKTSTALHLLKKPLDDIIPTLGFNSYILDSAALNKSKETKIELIDLGGSIKIRKLWFDYFPTAHGLICLLDSADSKRFEELKKELEQILANKNVQGKPLLVLLNKQDLDDAMDEVEILAEINIEQLVNDNKCPTKIEQCAVQNKNPASMQTTGDQKKKKKMNLDSGIEQGFNWIVNYILNNWEVLDERVRAETEKQEAESREKRDALREKYKDKDTGDTENNLDDKEKMNQNPFKPIEQVVKDLEKKEQRTKNGLKEENSKSSKLANIATSKKELLERSKANRNKLTEKLNEVKKKSVISRQNKVTDKPPSILEKQDSKQDLLKATTTAAAAVVDKTMIIDSSSTSKITTNDKVDEVATNIDKVKIINNDDDEKKMMVTEKKELIDNKGEIMINNVEDKVNENDKKASSNESNTSTATNNSISDTVSAETVIEVKHRD